jgi:hypothetical protein
MKTTSWTASRPIATATALLALGALSLSLCAPAEAASQPADPCRAVVTHGVIPAWARSGFSEARPRSAQVLGRAGRIDAILFADPLFSPPSTHKTNKILWVSRLPVGTASTLRIAAQRMVGSQRVGSPVGRVVAGGPGPSIIDLPAPGCWRLSLRWSGHTDSVDLAYTRIP